MTSPADRTETVELVTEAVARGSRLRPACREVGISARTAQRWREAPAGDRRPTAVHPSPPNKLTDEERASIVAVCHEPEFSSQSPATIVPSLADTGSYIASESTFYRVLHAANEQHHRGRARAPRKVGPPRMHVAERPCQVWTWDVTWLKGPVRGLFFYLYMIIDIYSRKIVGWEVWEEESAEHAVELFQRAVLAEQCSGDLEVVHADNGAIQKASTLRVKLTDLGVEPSYNRPGVSNDNAYSEALFRTCKYRPVYPEKGFAGLSVARRWCACFVTWYNTEHKHSSIHFVTPEQRHQGRDIEILARRSALYESAKARHPERWSRGVRVWRRHEVVHLNRQKAEPNVAVAA
jgi:putative transposase